jgi:hypothetical protein
VIFRIEFSWHSGSFGHGNKKKDVGFSERQGILEERRSYQVNMKNPGPCKG